MANLVGWMPLSQEVLPIFLRNVKRFLQIKFLAVSSSLGHLSMKNFSDRPYRLGSKIRQEKGTGGWQQPPIDFF